MSFHFSAVDFISLVLGLLLVASLIFGKTIYIGRGFSGPRSYDRKQEPFGFWLSFSILSVILGVLVGISFHLW